MCFVFPTRHHIIFTPLCFQGFGTSSFIFYHETVDNNDGLSIDADGSGDTWFLTGTRVGGSTTISTLTIDVGPEGNFRYSPVRLYLQSQCDLDGEVNIIKHSLPA